MYISKIELMGIYYLNKNKTKTHYKVELTMIMTDKRMLSKRNIYRIETKQNLILSLIRRVGKLVSFRRERN
jgi:hypothetical protein